MVVDPGVGSKRRAIAARTDRGIFVSPDNGALSLVLSAGDINVLEAVTLTNPAYQLSNVSATFTVMAATFFARSPRISPTACRCATWPGRH